MTSQPDLLAQFIAALRRDPHAEPPAELDPDLAGFTRRLLADDPSLSAADVRRIRARVWAKVMAAHRPIGLTLSQETPLMIAVERPRSELQPRRDAPSYTLLAAAAAVMLFAALITLLSLQQNGSPQTGSGAQQAGSTLTATPTAARDLSQTATPVAMPILPQPLDVLPTVPSLPGSVPYPGPLNIDNALEVAVDEVYEGQIAPDISSRLFFVSIEESGLYAASVQSENANVALMPALINPQSVIMVGAWDHEAATDAPVTEAAIAVEATPVGTATVVAPPLLIDARPLYGPEAGTTALTLVSDGQLPEDGLYFVVSAAPDESASFTFTVRQVEPQSATLGEALTGDLTDAMPYAVYALEAEAGDVYDVTVTTDGGLNARLDVLTEGYRLTDLDGGAGTDPELLDLGVTVDGTYWVVVTAEDETRGSYTLTIRPSE
jgi:hypothetical protein